MYLLDTNVFSGILLQRENSRAAKHIFTANPPTNLFITDFSLHSLSVFLFQRNKHEIYERFVEDIIIRTQINVVGLEPADVPALSKAS